MQILVIDDSRTMRKLVLRTLRQAGFGGHDIIEAGDGIKSYEAIRDQGPDIVLCDWNMPRMSGIDLLRQLRSAGDQRPFGFVTSKGHSGDARDRHQGRCAVPHLEAVHR